MINIITDILLWVLIAIKYTVLTILGIIGVVLLIIAIVLFILLFLPIDHKVIARVTDEMQYTHIIVKPLFKFIKVDIVFDNNDDDLSYRVKIFKKIFINSKEKKINKDESTQEDEQNAQADNTTQKEVVNNEVKSSEQDKENGESDKKIEQKLKQQSKQEETSEKSTKKSKDKSKKHHTDLHENEKSEDEQNKSIFEKIDEITDNLSEKYHKYMGYKNYLIDTKFKKKLKNIFYSIVYLIKQDKFYLTGEFGFLDPAKTAGILGKIYMVKGMFYIPNIEVSGNFEKEVMDIDLYMEGRNRLYKIVFPIVSFVFTAGYRLVRIYMKEKNITVRSYLEKRKVRKKRKKRYNKKKKQHIKRVKKAKKQHKKQLKTNKK